MKYLFDTRRLGLIASNSITTRSPFLNARPFSFLSLCHTIALCRRRMERSQITTRENKKKQKKKLITYKKLYVNFDLRFLAISNTKLLTIDCFLSPIGSRLYCATFHHEIRTENHRKFNKFHLIFEDKNFSVVS